MTNVVEVIGAPTDYGLDRRGVDMGPSAIRYAGLADHIERAGFTCQDTGDMAVPRAEERDPTAHHLGERAKFLPEVQTVSERLAESVQQAVDNDHLPLVLGGDHSISIGTLAGLSSERDIGILWFDAHGDFNTPATTPSGNIHGMSLAAILGLGEFAEMSWASRTAISSENVGLVGLRELDDGERENITASRAHAYTMTDIDEQGIAPIMDDALEKVCDGVDALHVSVDLDVLEPTEAPGVGTPVRGGLTYREAHTALELVAAHRTPLSSFELVEVNPILDNHNATAELAAELVGSLLGERILDGSAG